MTRKHPIKHKLTPTRNNNGVLNPGSKPVKWDKSMIAMAMFFAAEGLTEKEMALELKVHICTIEYWKTHKPEFLEALQKGKLVYTKRVEQSLLESAVGYSHPDTHFAVIDGKVVQTPIIKHYPPNVTAQIFYLKNRARDRWMDVHKFEGQINHRHLLDLTNLSDKELRVLQKVGLTELPEHGSNSN